MTPRQERWSAAELLEYQRSGKLPTRTVNTNALDVQPTEPNHATPKQKPVSTGRHHRVIAELDSLKFDSLTELRFYEYLMARPTVIHIDVHPTLTLEAGIRYKPDFLVWVCPDTGFVGTISTETYEVKGSKKLAHATDIQRIKALMQKHPAGPLAVFWWDKTSKSWRFD